MFPIKDAGAILRGKLSTTQVFLAAVIGSMLGFVPGFVLPGDFGGGLMQAPGLILALLFCVLILNCNLTVFGIVVVLAKLVSLPLMGFSFAVGRFLLDGPTSSLFEMMINAPVLAWFGLEYYATTGGLVVGLVFGVLTGSVLRVVLRSFRRAMARVEDKSALHKKHSDKRSTRFLTWLFLGGDEGKTTYRELLEQKEKGRPIRIAGMIAAAVLIGGLWLSMSLVGGRALEAGLRSALEQGNGATVDLAGLNLDLADNKLTLEGFAMADPDALETDLFRARQLNMDLGGTAFLRRRLVIDEVTSVGASSGLPRVTLGKRTIQKSPPPPPPPTKGDEKSIDDYLEEARMWSARLQQANRWLETIFGSGDEGEESPQQRDKRIEEEITAMGHARIAARHLISGAPLVLVRSIRLDGIAITGDRSQLIDIRARNISTDPALVADGIEISIHETQKQFGLDLKVDAGTTGDLTSHVYYKDLPLDSITGSLKKSSGMPLRGGTIDLSLGGGLSRRDSGYWIDLPLKLAIRGSTLAISGLKETKVDELLIPLGLRGPLASPRIRLDDTALTDALVAAGKAELANQLQAQAQKLIDKHKLGSVVGDLSKPGDALKKIATDATDKIENAKKKAADALQKKAGKELKKLLPGGLFGRKKK